MILQYIIDLLNMHDLVIIVIMTVIMLQYSPIITPNELQHLLV